MLARVKASAPSILVRCPRCSSNAMMQIRLGMTWSRTNQPVGGQKQVICADCHSRGEYVVVSF